MSTNLVCPEGISGGISDPADTMALSKLSNRNLLVKVHLKKNPEVEKLDGLGCIGNQTLYATPSSFFRLRFL